MEIISGVYVFYVGYLVLTAMRTASYYFAPYHVGPGSAVAPVPYFQSAPPVSQPFWILGQLIRLKNEFGDCSDEKRSW